mmetsp:Transcript_15022/g.44239  ORF Transcript_15022/g.44239 Transcript_15022/m.44239 type:complete len:230 (-) Transcript_15022:1475-2164(-)
MQRKNVQIDSQCWLRRVVLQEAAAACALYTALGLALREPQHIRRCTLSMAPSFGACVLCMPCGSSRNMTRQRGPTRGPTNRPGPSLCRTGGLQRPSAHSHSHLGSLPCLQPHTSADSEAPPIKPAATRSAVAYSSLPASQSSSTSPESRSTYSAVQPAGYSTSRNVNVQYLATHTASGCAGHDDVSHGSAKQRTPGSRHSALDSIATAARPVHWPQDSSSAVALASWRA